MKPLYDKARIQSDKWLNETEQEISRVYKKHPALIKAEKQYKLYMDMVGKLTKGSYLAFKNEKNIEHRKELEKAYKDEVRKLTFESREYQIIVMMLVSAISDANQKAMNIANSKMSKVYAENYNQIAVECKRIGIKVNGEEK